jgi:hypothetical protein
MSTSRILGEVFYIKDGNVGLGTSVPRTILDVQNSQSIYLNVPNIGIGTTLPQAKLHTVGTAIFDNKSSGGAVYIKGGVAGGTGPKLYLVGAGNAYSTTALEFQNYDTGIHPSVAQLLVFDEGNYSGSFRFSTKQSGAIENPLIEHVRIQTDGNVGIGTTLAQQKLHVAGSASISQNIGIGTTQSSHRLHIYSSTSQSNTYESSGILLENASEGELGIAFQNSLLKQANASWAIGMNSNQSRLDIVYGLQSNLFNQQDVKMSFMTNGNIGIGTTIALANFQVKGLSMLDSLYIRDAIQLSPLATSIRNALQVRPARLSQRLLNSQSNITLNMPGYYIAHSSNVQISINGFMLYHFTSDIANYNLTTTHLNQGTTTQFSIDFIQSLNQGDLVDVTVWPNVIEVDASQGNVLQVINNIDNVWELTTSNVSGLEQFYTKDAYYKYGNLGIGTTQPKYPLDIYASTTHLNNVYFTSNAIGIGTAIPQYELDIKGNMILTGNIYKNNELYVSSQWLTPPLTSNIYLLNSNVGIGTSIPLAKLHVVGPVILGDITTSSVTTSNINVLGDQFFYNNDTTTTRARLQVKPIQIKFLAPSNITQYFTTIDGIWKFESSNTNIFLNGTKLAYINSNLNDYSVSYENLLATTNITIAFEHGLIQTQDAVDIELWPSYLSDSASNQPGFLLQNIQQQIQLTSNSYVYSGDYFFTHNSSTSNLSTIELVTNVGIGTNLPQKKLDVKGDINITNGQLYYNLTPIVSSQWTTVNSSNIAVASVYSVGIGTQIPLNPLHVEGGIQMSFGPVATIFINGGDITITSTGKRYYGFNIAWENASLTGQKSFRVSGQFHMVNSDGSHQGYLEIDSLITPYNNNSDSPKELVSLNANTFTTNAFTELTYDIIRSSATAVDMRFKWWITSQPFQVYFEGRVFGTQSLGKITLQEIQGTWS